ncbi:hypothetical protein H5410_050851, partial [Solanum commersonii]
APLIPCTTLGIGFLQSLGLRVGTCLRRVDEGCVNLDNLFKRFGHRESYDRFQQEFFISRVDWERHRAIVFVVALLGIMIFPKKRGCVDINLLSMIWVLEQFYQRKVENGTEVDLCNKIRSHAMRLSIWNTLNNEEGWRLFPTHL